MSYSKAEIGLCCLNVLEGFFCTIAAQPYWLGHLTTVYMFFIQRHCHSTIMVCFTQLLFLFQSSILGPVCVILNIDKIRISIPSQVETQGCTRLDKLAKTLYCIASLTNLTRLCIEKSSKTARPF